jgi:protein N-lysine methyltransferase METTL21A
MIDEVDKHLFDVPELIHFKIVEENPILPNQMPATPKQVTEVAVSCDQPNCPSLLLKLAVDASPGCGGIAWPAGCVSAFFLLIFGSSRLAAAID